MRFALFLLVAFIIGCSEDLSQGEFTPAKAVIYKDTKRFSVQSHGEFYGGYGDHGREIFIVKDNQTGVEYLVITGAGATQLSTEQQGKNTVTVED